MLRVIRTMKTAGLEKLLAGVDATQKGLLDEACILVDQNDRPIGTASKLDAHILQNGTSPLHRV